MVVSSSSSTRRIVLMVRSVAYVNVVARRPPAFFCKLHTLRFKSYVSLRSSSTFKKVASTAEARTQRPPATPLTPPHKSLHLLNLLSIATPVQGSKEREIRFVDRAR